MLDAVGILLCEAASAVITGWDLLVVHILYGVFVCLLMGAGVAVLAKYARNRRKQR